MAFVGVEIRGFKELTARLSRAPGKGHRALAKALYVEGQGLLHDTLPHVPVDLGALRASGEVSLPTIVGPLIEVEVGFGGPTAPYAIYVHEIPPPPPNSPTQGPPFGTHAYPMAPGAWVSAYHNPPTSWKFLQRTAFERMSGIDERVGLTVAVALSI